MKHDHFAIQVESYAGYRDEEAPQRFYLGGRRIDVIEIIDRWLAPDHRYFKVRGNDEGVYILRYDGAKERWELTAFDSGGREETRLSST